MRADDTKVINLLVKAALLTRRAGEKTISDGHRLSETNRPLTCARCLQQWPCATERNARIFVRAAGELRAAARVITDAMPFATKVERIRSVPSVVSAFDTIANRAIARANTVDTAPAIGAILRAAGMGGK